MILRLPKLPLITVFLPHGDLKEEELSPVCSRTTAGSEGVFPINPMATNVLEFKITLKQ